MVNNIINTRSTSYQTFFNNTFKDEGFMDKYLRNFVDDLILENATKHKDYFTLFVSDLSHGDKKIYLSYLVNQDLFKELTENLHREMEAIKEYEPEMQFFIDQRIDQVYFNYMDDKKNNSDDYQCLTTSLT